MAIDNPLAKLQMTVRFYHPSLIEYIARMEKCIEDFHNGRGAFYLHALEKRTDPPLAEVFKQELDRPFMRLKDVREGLLKEIDALIKDYT
jgi:hypothetical protein